MITEMEQWPFVPETREVTTRIGVVGLLCGGWPKNELLREVENHSENGSEEVEYC